MTTEEESGEIVKQEKEIVLKLSDIVKRAQQIAIIMAVVGPCFSLFWYYAVIQKFNERDRKDVEQDKKIELIIKNQSDSQRSYYAMEKDIAILKTQFTRFEDSLISIRDYLKNQYKRGSEK